MSGPRTVAVFDFDGTLTRMDTLVPFLVAVSARRTARHLPRALARARSTDGGRDGAKSTLIGDVLRDEPTERIDDLGRRYVDRVVRRMLRPDVIARLRAHQALGHRTMVASASPAPVIEPAATWLGIDDVVCTQLAAPSALNPRWRITGDNVRGAEKRRQVAAAVGERDGLTVWAYGNLPHDRELLDWADRAVVVKRGARVPTDSLDEPRSFAPDMTE